MTQKETTVSEPVGIIFACDESEAKGYADKDEAQPGEVGVFAGILLPESEKESKLPAFQALYQKYKPESGKLHIADLEPHVQQQLRDDVYNTIKSSGLACFWYAIHVAGFHQHNSAFGAAATHVPQAPGSRYRRGNNPPKPESLHAALFEGLYAHLIAYCEERWGGEVNIEVRTDEVDKPVKKMFEQAAYALLDFGPTTKKVPARDMQTGQTVEGSVTINTIVPDSLKIDTRVIGLNFPELAEGDGLVLAADVLANSLGYLFKKRNPKELYGDLNRPEAIAEHPLASSLNSFRDWGNRDLIGDGLYRHPKK